ncbi:aa3-type cytochrome oxidase subunit CtaJ [Williamsia sterculiae]|uniref:Uncharacterized protein n=1 Tax=Williamsia sterculiae TaxID=1344003 RepID=A0A1N7GK42_9NOCA|nr:hypothetical protein [Williamsia sterculiae]SIS12971.1 hypothetical protein SAMN05445060_2894 [Williamsia sterculiae]
MEDVILWVGIVVVILTVLSVLLAVGAMAVGGKSRYRATTTYRLSEKWDHKPLLFSATDIEPVAAPSHGAHGTDDLIGGSASGKW